MISSDNDNFLTNVVNCIGLVHELTSATAWTEHPKRIIVLLGIKAILVLDNINI